MHVIFVRTHVNRWTIGADVFEVAYDETNYAYVWTYKLSEATRAQIGDIHAFRTRWGAADFDAEEIHCWRCFVYPPSGGEQRREDIGDWRHSVPLRGITETLNQLARDGWSVVTSSEDKQVIGET